MCEKKLFLKIFLIFFKYSFNMSVCSICDHYRDLITLDCDHEFCDHCLIEYISVKIDDKESEILCPHQYCSDKINHDKLLSILSNDDELLSKYKNTLNDNQSLEGLNVVMCPNCQKICKKKEHSYETDCSDCYQSFCRICGEIDYYSNHCDMYCPNESDIENDLSEIRSALDDCDIKLCPLCKIIIERTEGCNSMKCKYCKLKFCWSCLKTCHEIKKLENHECESYGTYGDTGSNDEYNSGSDLSDID